MIGLSRASVILLLAGVLGLSPAVSPRAAAEPGTLASRGVVSGYRYVDLGLGGDSSAAGVNDLGEVVGGSPTPIAFVWSGGRVRLLGTLGGGSSFASAINNHTQVVGTSRTSSGLSHVFLWSNGRMRDLGFSGTANAINGHGVIVGMLTPRAGQPYAYRWSGGKLTSLTRYGIQPGPRTQVFDINDAGQIVGVDAAGPFRLTGTRLERLSRPSARMSDARSIDSQGTVAGSGLVADGTGRAMVWTPSGTRVLGTLGAYTPNGQKPFSVALGINDLGRVVGYSSISTSPDQAPVVWSAGVMIALPTPMGAPGYARAVNRHGMIVGEVDAAPFGNAAAWLPDHPT
jgi:probable HAF family extracellular repeat protein